MIQRTFSPKMKTNNEEKTGNKLVTSNKCGKKALSAAQRGKTVGKSRPGDGPYRCHAFPTFLTRTARFIVRKPAKDT